LDPGLTLTVSEADIQTMSDDELVPLLHMMNRLDRESYPRHTDMTIEDMRMFDHSPGMAQQRLLVHDEGDLAATAVFRHNEDGTNPDVLMVGIRVLPEHRRRGIATMLLGRAVTAAIEMGRDKLQGFILDTVPAGDEFMSIVGAEKLLDFHENVMRVDALDRDLLQSWVDQGPVRGKGYSVRLVEGDWPEELFDDIARMLYVLERDMPRSASFEPREWNAELVRELQDHYAAGVDALSVFVYEDATGVAIGMTDMIRRKTDPSTWMVTMTMVDPDHRGRSLGKWIKGLINLTALEKWEGGIYTETGNAFTNEPMLAINHAMGFTHELTMTDCLLTVDQARIYLESRGQV
jgi:GNAT superfamily N-acetyltransferase